MAQKRILLIGLDPKLVDFSQSRSGPDPEKVRAAGNSAHEVLMDRGYEVQSCLVDLGETAEAVVRQTLSQNAFDCILIGAGIRALVQHTVLFEKVINAVRENAPSAKLCFNTNPGDTVEAVERRV
jgi:hypothetical protein